MAFDQFTSLGLTEYMDANRADDALWLFIHIPKTAGSSLSNELARLRKPYRNIHIDYTLKDVPHGEQMQRAVDRFIEEARARPFAAASGHITIEHARQIRAAIPNTKFVTFLREPVARVISDFRYARTPKHPPYQEFIKAFPDFQSYIRNEVSQNKMALHMGGSDPAAVFKEFDFIGALELYPMSFNIFFALMGERALPQLHERKTQPTADNDVTLTAELEEEVRTLNAGDVRLFDAVRSALRTQRPAWREWRQPPAKRAATRAAD